MDDKGRIESVVVVGGGTAGWLSAAYLTRLFGPRTAERLKITLVESSDIGIIGVGEATIPTLRHTLRRIGIDERDFMVKGNATLKLAIKFVNWHRSPADDPNDIFWHPFGSLPVVNGVGVASYWLKNRHRGLPPFAKCFSAYPGLCENLKSPKSPKSKPFGSEVAYAYHIDAALFGQALRDVAKGRGVRHIVDNVVAVETDERGFIDRLKLEKHGELKADLYLDCSGFRSLLLQQTLKEPFVPYGDGLLCDSAIAIPVPWPEQPREINCYTTATGLDAGWSWDIPLSTRRGRGYVYSSRHATPEQAETEFRRFIGDEAGEHGARHLKMKVGRTRRLWVNNCIAVGLSGGFIEPLESTAIFMVELGLSQLALQFPDKSFDPHLQRRYNELMTDVYDHTRDFIVYHYCITEREDTAFWKDNKHNLKLSDELSFLMEMWTRKIPTQYDFTAKIPLFGYINYVFIMAGHGAWPKDDCANSEFLDDAAAVKVFQNMQKSVRRMTNSLPDHAAYVRWIQGNRDPAAAGEGNGRLAALDDVFDGGDGLDPALLNRDPGADIGSLLR
jgi:tryptophan halogenase